MGRVRGRHQAVLPRSDRATGHTVSHSEVVSVAGRRWRNHFGARQQEGTRIRIVRGDRFPGANATDAALPEQCAATDTGRLFA